MGFTYFILGIGQVTPGADPLGLCQTVNDQHSECCTVTIGDLVLIKDFHPGHKKWLPGEIIELLGPVSDRVKLSNG